MQATTDNPTSLGIQHTTLARPWLLKTLIVAIAFIALGVWGLVDALVIYPKRGATAAEAFEHQYLSQLQTAATLTNDTAKVEDPVATLDRLRTKSREAAGSGSAVAPLEKARLDWLTQLKLIGKLVPANTTFPRDDFRMNDQGQATRVASAPERYESLKAKWTAGADGKVPKSQPLDWYDIPVQWIFVLVGGIAGPWMLANIMRAKNKVYKYDDNSKHLTLPTSESFGPSDIVDVDKSKWDKFYITFKIRDGHPTLAGKSITLDLYHHVPLEDWALAMESASNVGTSKPSETSAPTA
jgi:hypothetical protein